MMLRCAIYTRKSTDEGLEQEFNSLDAQREACEAYIKSQKHEGWKLLPQYYDDGGYSGGSMERPALKKLLQEIEAGRVDIIVVYKVDRLTRALSDFARMVELFDKNKVSFVSVTQQFNTTTSMGRLTLNVLLSFAQFEREVTAERIRDKIAASKKKGMWMGSPPPLGYDVQDKKLVVNEQEAEAVRTLFDLYLNLGSVRALKEEADRRGIRTKHRPNTKNEGNKPFSRGNLYVLLSNHLYVGEVRHKKAIYPGQHEAIIDRAIWDRVQQTLAGNRTERGNDSNTTGPHLLTGRIFDENGAPLCPTHTNKKGKRYNYYISKHLMHASRTPGEDGWRVPAHELEAVTMNAVKEYIADQKRLTEDLKLQKSTSRDQADLKQRMKSLALKLDEAVRGNEPDVVGAVVKSVTLIQDSLTVDLYRSALLEVLRGMPIKAAAANQTVEIRVPIRIGRRGIETKIVLSAAENHSVEPDVHLVELIAKAHTWFEDLTSGRVSSVEEIFQREAIDDSDASKVIGLAFLSPQMIQRILEGTQAVGLTAKRLLREKKIGTSWVEQEFHISH